MPPAQSIGFQFEDEWISELDDADLASEQHYTLSTAPSSDSQQETQNPCNITPVGSSSTAISPRDSANPVVNENTKVSQEESLSCHDRLRPRNREARPPRRVKGRGSMSSRQLCNYNGGEAMGRKQLSPPALQPQYIAYYPGAVYNKPRSVVNVRGLAHNLPFVANVGNGQVDHATDLIPVGQLGQERYTARFHPDPGTGEDLRNDRVVPRTDTAPVGQASPATDVEIMSSNLNDHNARPLSHVTHTKQGNSKDPPNLLPSPSFFNPPPPLTGNLHTDTFQTFDTNKTTNMSKSEAGPSMIPNEAPPKMGNLYPGVPMARMFTPDKPVRPIDLLHSHLDAFNFELDRLMGAVKEPVAFADPSVMAWKEDILNRLMIEIIPSLGITVTRIGSAIREGMYYTNGSIRVAAGGYSAYTGAAQVSPMPGHYPAQAHANNNRGAERPHYADIPSNEAITHAGTPFQTNQVHDNVSEKSGYQVRPPPIPRNRSHTRGRSQGQPARA